MLGRECVSLILTHGQKKKTPPSSARLASGGGGSLTALILEKTGNKMKVLQVSYGPGCLSHSFFFQTHNITLLKYPPFDAQAQASQPVYITAMGNMMLGVKLFIDPFRACPGRACFCVMSWVGLSVGEGALWDLVWGAVDRRSQP